MGALKWIIVSVATVLSIYFLFLSPQGFTEADINDMKASIKSEFEKRGGLSVTEVVMIKESSNRVVGFAKIRAPILGEFTKNCSATMAEGGRSYMWRCD